MSLIVSVSEAEGRFSELLARVEAGEDVIIARGREPIAKIIRTRSAENLGAAIEELKASRAGLPPVRHDELLAWRDEGRRVE
jgi:prevent-host-death family protein